MNFGTQLGINRENLTQRTRELAIDSEPELKLSPFLAHG